MSEEDDEEAMDNREKANRFENFMSFWTTIVSDPVMSKWIVLVLAASVFLNGYLLKGLGSSTLQRQQTQQSVTALLEQAPTKSSECEPPSSTTYSQKQTNGIIPAHTKEGDPTPSPPLPVLPPSDGEANAPVPPEPVERRSDLEPCRSLEECLQVFNSGPDGVQHLNNEEVVLLAQHGKIAAYALEKVLGDLERAVLIRRALICKSFSPDSIVKRGTVALTCGVDFPSARASTTQTLEYSDIPVSNYDYSRVLGACCENVIGYMPIPLGIAGPLKVDGKLYPIPMATAEGTLVASTSRGCKALNAGAGVTTVLTQDAMTRGPVVEFPNITEAAKAKRWIDSPEGSTILRDAFDSTSRFARLQSLRCALAGRTLYIRFATSTGDAMGMNMISKGVEKALTVMSQEFPRMSVLALSGNYCTDKKPAAINWIEGRGKSVVAEAVISGKVVKEVLKTTVTDLCNLNLKKNLIGSAMAGSIGGFNAHASNILTAIFLATGQDPAQNVESSMCMTLMEP